MFSKKMCASVCAGLSVLIPFLSLQARDESDYTIELSKKLNAMQIYDYSELLLNNEIAKNKPDADLVRIQLAMTYFTMNKPEQAEKIIASIPSSSAYYADSRRVTGLEAIKKGKNDLGIKSLEEYFAKVKDSMPTSNSGIEDFKEAIGYLSHVYRQAGNPDKAAEVVGRMSWLKKPEEGDAKSPQSADKREADLLVCQAKLDAVEQMILAGKTGWDTTANSCMNTLKELLWVNDSISAFGSIEMARVYFFLGRYDEALKTLEDPSRQYEAYDEVFKEEKMLGNAPAPLASYWVAKINLAKAEKATSQEDKIKFYSSAIKALYKIVDKYDSFFKFAEVSGLFLDTKQKLTDLGKNVRFPDHIEAKLQQDSGGADVPAEAEKFFSDEKYKEAMPYYLAAAVKSRKTRKGMADVLSKLSYCYVKTDQPLEALTLAGYLADYFPKSDGTPLALLQVGEYLWSKNQIDDALVVYEDFVRNCPADQYAGPISARVAKVHYDRATQMAKEAEKLPQGQEKLEKTQAARDAFKSAIPKYERIVNNYLQSEHGPQSCYLLAYCQTYSKDLKGGAGTFLKYCDIDLKRKKPNYGDIADAKLRVADNYYQLASALDKEAKALKEKTGILISEKKDGAPAPSPEPEAPESESPEEEKDLSPATTAKDGQAPADPAAVAKTDSDPKAVLAEAAKLEKEAKGYYSESIKNLSELLGPWLDKGGSLESDNSPKTQSSIETATALIGWAYDGLDEKDKACKAFADFMKKYPTSKQIPVCMFRLGSIYLEMDKPDLAAQVLEKLASDYPSSNEGKQALSSLGRSMYDIGKYDKSIEAFSKILVQNIDLSIPVMRWIVEKLPDCGGTHPKEGAEIAVRFAEKLLKLLDKPNFVDWVGREKAAEIEKDPKEAKKMLSILKEKVLYDAANASFWAGNFESSVKFLDELLLAQNTPYYVEGRFLRAEAYKAMKKYNEAVNDYSAISMMAMTAKKISLQFKAQCLTGDAYVDMDEFQKAAGAFNIIAMCDPSEQNPDVPEQERKDRLEWIEYALYKAALCQAKLGLNEEKGNLIAKYRKYFPSGKFISDLDKMPTAAPASPSQAPKKTDKKNSK